jgi:hypothetical protein
MSRHSPRHKSTSAVDESSTRLFEVFEETLRYARERDYRGWDYGDGMSSRLLQSLPIEHKWVNIAVQETVKRSPVNLRPLFLVEQRRNYKGTALFAMANLTADELTGDGGPFDSAYPAVDYRAEAASLLEWLVEERITDYAGYCGSHRHPIQHLDGRGVPNDPDVVSTSYGVKALLRGADVDARYPRIASTVRDFVVEDLDYEQVSTGATIRYHMNHPDTYFTINAGALGARIFLDLYDHFGSDEYRRRATEILDHVAGLQTDAGGWYYRDPPDSSHLSMDNHHNGFVIESFQRYGSVVDADRFDETLATALDFYRRDLFQDDGAPNFDESSPYPRDIHASTQGALVFSYADEHDFARTILDWVLDNLYQGDGRFFYKKGRFVTHRVTLMRWCQAWMAYALGEHLRTSTAPDELGS